MTSVLKLIKSCLHQNILICQHVKATPKAHCTLFSSRFQSTGAVNNNKVNLITTPIFYVNAEPHVGHLYCALLADVTARWQRIKGQTTLFSTGTDEHGLKIQQAATSAGKEPKEYCDEVAAKFKVMFDTADVQYDRFIRTTDEDHKRAVSTFWNKLMEGGFIYKGSYAGWYSVSDEAFLLENEVETKAGVHDTQVKVSKETGHVVTWTEEKNYKFRLSQLQQDLLHWLNSGAIYPKHYEQEVRKMLQVLPDLSITRDRSRLTWGIGVPGDPEQTIYVWLDALINYLTIAGYPDPLPHPWPPHTQIVGKEILKFHAVYWPAFLIAAGLAPPTRLVVHSHWLVENVKMSKSLGNVVDPLVKMADYGVDGFRYFLLNEGSLGSDGTYSDRRVVERINSDLVNTLGNLLGRCTAPSVNKKQEFPHLNENHLFEFLSREEREVYKSLHELPESVDILYEDFHFTKALDLIMSKLRWTNALIQSHAPWQLAKSCDPLDEAHLQLVLHVAMETLRVCGILLQPVVPGVSDRLLGRLGVRHDQRTYANATSSGIEAGTALGEKLILYKRV